MGDYGNAAIVAVNLIRSGYTPESAWARAVELEFPNRRSVKDCPKCTFLGLCGEGLIQGIRPGKHTRSVKNKSYGIKAIAILSVSPQLADDKKSLWNRVLDGQAMSHNYQMDVVISLWKEGLIRSGAAIEVS